MLRPLASVIRRAPHSRTCATLPGADSSAGRNTVWIESTMSTRGLTASSSACTADRSLSAHSSSPSPRMPSRSARILTCAADSSAVTYSTGGVICASLRAASSTSVDLPMPGSPPIRMSEPRTRPPPSTRSSSPMPVSVRSPRSITTSVSGIGRVPAAMAPRRPLGAGAARSSTSGTSSPVVRLQSGHVPGFGVAKPHCWQR